MADAITYVGVGTVGATDGATNPAPTLPAGLADDDLMLCFFYSREAIDGTVAISAGWTEIINDRNAGGLFALWYRFRVAADVAPTLTLTNHAAGDTAIAQIAAWRGVSTSDPIDNITGMTTNGAQVNIGALPGMPVGRKVLIVALGGKLDDWSSVSALSGDSLTWAEIAENPSTLGNDAGMVWDYAISTFLEINLSNYTFSISGGGSVQGKGILISFNLEVDAFVAADDLVFYCAESHPMTDSGSPGGEIDDNMRAVFTDLAANDDIEALSSDASDTSILAIAEGRDSSGNLVTEILSLNGTTAVIFSTLGLIDDMISFRLLEPAVGTITVRRSVAGTTISTIPPGELGFRRLFVGAYAHPNNSKDYYEKIFVKNIHPVTTLENASVIETADPGADNVFTLATTLDDAASADDRLTAPSTDDTNPDTFDATEKFLPESSNLDPGEACGIWIRMTVPAAQAATKNTYTLTVAGDVAL